MDITYYVGMDFPPVGQLRNYTNEHPDRDPVRLIYNVSFRLNLILFRGRDYGTEPYRMPNDITSWIFAADRDYDQSTTPLIEGDNANITCQQTETETRLIIPFRTDSPLLSALMAEYGIVQGIIGEVAGFPASGNSNASFCLQIPDMIVGPRIV
jgi:hypothetical protein